MKKLKFILIGAGGRGTRYVMEGDACCPEMELIAVADPNPVRRNYIRNHFGLSEEQCYEWGEALLKQPKRADIAIIATQDKDHFHLAMEAIRQGYHLLLEKPAAPSPEQCLAIELAAKEQGVKVLICHVLRFTPFFGLIKKTLEDGRLGKIVNLMHSEGVGNLHYSHSYIRGDWHNTAESSPMILSKSCHDIDIIGWLMDEPCTRVHSFGSLLYFREENKPEGAPEFCYQNCPHKQTCPYSALKLYRHRQVPWFARHATKKHDPTEADIEELIHTTNYGRCVFRCDNDVVDHQEVNLEFASGATASFTMSALNEGGRRIRIMGTRGELEARMGDDHISLYDFSTRKREEIKISDAMMDESIAGGHGGGDRGIIRALCQVFTGQRSEDSIADIAVSIENHLVAFAAEHSRLTGQVVSMEEYRAMIQGRVSK